MKSKLSLIVSFLMIFASNLQAQAIRAQWGESFYSTTGKALNSGNFTTTMCSDGSFYATCMFSDEIRINNYIYYAYGGTDMMIVKYNRNKSLQWVYQIHQYNNGQFNLENSFLGENNSLYLGFEYDSAITLGADTTIIAKPKGSDKRNALIVKMNPNGKLAWVQNFGTTILVLCQSGNNGCYATNYTLGITYRDTLYRKALLHFTGNGILDYVINDIGIHTDFINRVDSELIARGSMMYGGYTIVGTDTIKTVSKGMMGYYAKLKKNGPGVDWVYRINNKGLSSPYSTNHQTLMDKSGNIYFVDNFAGDSVFINGKMYSFGSGSIKAGLLQLDKNGNFLKFVCDSLFSSGENQNMQIALSADSTKLLLAVYSNSNFWMPGVGDLNGPVRAVFVLDILQNLKCVQFFNFNLNSIYCFNPWDFMSYAYCRNLNGTSSVLFDTITVNNTAGSNVAIVYFSDKKVTGMQFPYSGKSTAIYPNPAHGEFTVQAGSEIRSITLMDVSGREVLNTSGNGYKEVTLSRAGISNGVYLVKITTAEGSLVRRVVLN